MADKTEGHKEVIRSTQDGELDTKDLDQVAGGFNPQPEPPRNMTPTSAVRTPLNRGSWGRIGRG